LLHGAIGDITDMGHDVGTQFVHGRSDPERPLRPVDRTEMGIGDGDDSYAVQSLTESWQGDIHLVDPRNSHGLPIAPDQENCGDENDRGGHRT
jgi:hypothetical protein